MLFLRLQSLSGLRASGRLRSRWLRWGSIALTTLVGLATLLLAVAVFVLHRLEEPWIKARLQALVRSSAGVDIDYRAARVDLGSGAHVEDLVVLSPPEVRRSAPEWVRVGRADVRWSLRSLLGGGGPRVASIALSDVAVTMVMDEHGRTTLDALPPSPPSPGTPLSHLASKFFAGPPPVGAVDVDPVTLTLLRTEGAAVVERATLSGLPLALTARPADPPVPGWRLHAQIGSATRELELHDTRPREESGGTARGALLVTIEAASDALAAALDLRMSEQTFAAHATAGQWLHAEATMKFDPAAGRTAIDLGRLEAADGAAQSSGSIDLPDTGDPVIRHAHGDVDLARLLRWLPPGLLPVTAERARLRFDVDSLAAGAAVRLGDGGKVAADVDLANVAVRDPLLSLDVGEGALAVRASPADGPPGGGSTAGGGVAAQASLDLTQAGLTSNDLRLSGDKLGLRVDGRQAPDGALAGTLDVRFARLERAGASPVVLRDGHLGLDARGLKIDSQAPLATRGDVGVTLDVASIDARSAASRVFVDTLALRGHTALEGHEPYALDVEAPMKWLRFTGAGGRALADAPARVELHAHDLHPDSEHPVASRGAGSAVVDLGDVHATVDATKDTDAVDFAVAVDARSLRALRPFLAPESLDAAPWDRMATTLASKGRVDRLASARPFVRQATEIHVDRPELRGTAAQSLALTLKSQGDAMKHHLDAELHAPGLVIRDAGAGDEHVTLTADLDRQQPSLAFRLATEGHATSTLAGAFSFDRDRRALRYDVDGHFGGLAPLAALAAKTQLAGFDLSQLEVDVGAHGALLGVVASVGPDGSIAYQAEPARTAAVEGKADLRVAHLRWTHGDTAIASPAFAWHAAMRVAEERRVLESHMEIQSVHLDLGSRQMDIGGVDDQTTVSVAGDLANPDLEVKQNLTTRSVQQTFAPEYPLGDLKLSIAAERGPEGIIHLSDVNVANGAAGTALDVTGNIDLATSRRTFSITTSLTQDLARLSTIPDRFKGRGKVAVEATITSPDLVHVHARAAVKGDDVTVSLPHAGIEVDQANGDVPVTVALEIGKDGVTLARNEKHSPYSMLRFADQHPLLNRSGFLSIAHLKTPFVAIAPLVGNLEIDQNVVSLRQFEMGVRGGSITGQCGVDWNGARSTMELHVRASGVQSSHGEPFDGNIAIVLSAADRSIDGRAEVLRIGERHLLDLLDLQDPQHVDPAINRIRAALALGYPDKLHLKFDHGFASAHLELGGLARLISISELRGIPMGPIVDKLLAPILEGNTAKETP